MTKIDSKNWLHHEAAPGVLLVAAALLAMLIANSSWHGFYTQFLAIPVNVSFSEFSISKPLLLWVNDGLMAVFFFLIGLEVKREILEGHLSSPSQLILPAAAAIAGIVVPALVYLSITGGDEIASRGWAIPAATDIAFALGVFSLIGRRLPTSLKLFLLSVAIFDDIGAIVIIALFYSQELSTSSLIIGFSGLAALYLLNRLRVKTLAPYILISIVVWAAVLKSGVHATLAGFAAAWFIPLTVNNRYGLSLLKDLEHNLHPWVAFFILPLFAFANAGVNLSLASADQLLNPITVGIAAGLFLGKQIGIAAISWCVIRCGWAKLPEGASWRQFYGVAMLCGIGFTMSLFIGSLAFEGYSASILDNVKLGVLIGSILSAVVATWLLAGSKAPHPQSNSTTVQPNNSGVTS